MKAENNKQITQGYLRFSIGLLFSVAIFVLAIFLFLHTAKVEWMRAEAKTAEYDRIYARQVEITEKLGVLYPNVKRLSDRENIDNKQMQRIVGNDKMQLISQAKSIPPADAKLYSRLLGQLNTIISVKDSIVLMYAEQNRLKAELDNAQKDYDMAKKNLVISSITNQQ